MNCEICDSRLTCRWCDVHGIGACQNCGAPYRIYHYENDKRVNKPPELLIEPEWLEWTKAYWKDCGRNVAPGAFNIPGSSYEVATPEDVQSLEKWSARNKHLEPTATKGGE